MYVCLISYRLPFPLCRRNQSMLFGGSPRYENVPLIGRGSPPPSVRWPYEALVSLVWWGWRHHWTQPCCNTNTKHTQRKHEHNNTSVLCRTSHFHHTERGVRLLRAWWKTVLCWPLAKLHALSSDWLTNKLWTLLAAAWILFLIMFKTSAYTELMLDKA